MVNYECNICSFITKNKRNYIQHNNTNKHKIKVLQTINPEKQDNYEIKSHPSPTSIYAVIVNMDFLVQILLQSI